MANKKKTRHKKRRTTESAGTVAVPPQDAKTGNSKTQFNNNWAKLLVYANGGCARP